MSNSTNSVKTVLEGNPTIEDLCNAATLRLGAIDAMALQVGSESFGEWSEGIRDSYGTGIALAVRGVVDLINQIHDQAKREASS